MSCYIKLIAMLGITRRISVKHFLGCEKGKGKGYLPLVKNQVIHSN
ncbi:MAG: hypothetical protein ABIS01_12750 [Ferruginibacter sp.]